MVVTRAVWIRRAGRRGGAAVAGLIAVLAAAPLASAQTLRFDADRELQVPERANIRFGNWFYSDFAFYQSAAYRYVRTSGPGADVLFDEDRGRVREDGSDFPLVSQLSVRNGVVLGKSTEVDLSFDVRYRYFPLGSEDDSFEFDMVDLGLYAHMGEFTFSITEDAWLGQFNGSHVDAYGGSRGAGVSGNFGFDFTLSPTLLGRLYERPAYRLDYVDQRGLTDDFSGDAYRVFENIVGIDLDWLLGKNKDLTVGGSRTDTIPDDDRYDNVRGVLYRTGLGYYQQVNPLFMAGGRADYQWRFYTADEVDRADQFQQDYSVFANLDPTDRTTLRFSVGYSRAELADPGAFEEAGSSDTVTGQAQLETRLSPYLTHAVTASRSQRAGYSAGVEVADEFSYRISWASEFLSAQAYTSYRTVDTELARVSGYNDWVSSLTISKPLAPNFSVHASTAYTVRDNGAVAADAVGAGDVYVESDYDTWVNTLGFTWALTPRATLSSFVEHLERTSDERSLQFSRNTAQVTAVYAYDF